MDEQVLLDADANMAIAWRRLCSGSPGGFVEEDDELLLLATGAPEAFFNPLFPKRRVGNPQDAIERIMATYRSWGVPGLAWVRAGSDEALLDAARRAGLEVGDGPPLMVMDPIADGPAPSIAVHRVTDAAGVEVARRVAAAGFGIDEDLMRIFLGERTLAIDGLVAFVGEVDGAPVSTAVLVVTGATAGIYTVATPEEHRGHGYGETLTWAAVAAGREMGCTRSILQASPMGFPVYERMGFVDAGRYQQFVVPA